MKQGKWCPGAVLVPERNKPIKDATYVEIISSLLARKQKEGQEIAPLISMIE